MKTLILYIDGVKCQFRGGAMTIKTPMRFNQNWIRRNRKEVNHYKDLTSKQPSR